MLQLIGLGEDGRVALEVFFDIEDVDAAIEELDAAHARFEAAPLAGTAAGECSKLCRRTLLELLCDPRLGRNN